MPTFGQLVARRVFLSAASEAAKPCARFVHDSVARAAQGGSLHSVQGLVPAICAALANTLGDFPDARIQGSVEAAHGRIVP